MMRVRLVFFLFGFVFSSGLHPWGDDGHGAYQNPVMPMDVSDLDAIRVGQDYYALSSTIQFSPGMAVLHSKDLVNWKMIGHVVPDITKLDANLNWDKMNQYGKGVWAGSIRYHAGRFWVYFNVPTTGFFMSTATDPAGPWTPVHNVWKISGWDDPCPFWDDDGRGYLVATNFADAYKIHLFRLTADGQSIAAGSDRVIHQSKGSEANKLYKFNGLYYHLFSDVKPEGRVVEMERSKSLAGPWEIRQLNHVNAELDKEPNQGGLVDDKAGHWYFVSHQGTGDWEGRAGVLLPVFWLNGWPVIGTVGPDGIGKMVWNGKKPIDGFARTELAHTDQFDGSTMAPEWEWNHQPRTGKWSLTENPGFLRLHAFPAIRKGNFFTVGNVVTQRSLRTDRNQVMAKVRLDGMQNGDEAGLVHFADSACALEVSQKNGHRRILLRGKDAVISGQSVDRSWIWLQSTWHYDGQSQFAYSVDGRHFRNIGPPYRLTWGNFRGDRIGLFTVNDAADGGFVDIDSFTYTVSQ